MKRADETIAEWETRLTGEQKTELKAWVSAHRWHVNQLRHSAATRVRKEFGLEAASVVLGHAKPDTTLIYAAKDEALAAVVAAKIG